MVTHDVRSCACLTKFFKDCCDIVPANCLPSSLLCCSLAWEWSLLPWTLAYSAPPCCSCSPPDWIPLSELSACCRSGNTTRQAHAKGTGCPCTVCVCSFRSCAWNVAFPALAQAWRMWPHRPCHVHAVSGTVAALTLTKHETFRSIECHSSHDTSCRLEQRV